jgi:TonB family protein
MKLFKKILLVLLVLSNSLTFGQDNNIDKSDKALDNGIRRYKKKEYEKAALFLKESIKNYPQQKAYYYLALTALALNDTCEYCDNINYGGWAVGENASKLYDSLCFKRKIINYNNGSSPARIYFSELATQICTKKTYQTFYIKNVKNGLTSSFGMVNYDSVASRDIDFFVKHPELMDISSDKLLFLVVEEMPEYPGGDKARINFLVAQLRYPQVAKESGIQGTVYVSFIVESDGSVSNVRVLMGVGGGLDEESVRVVKLMPKWIPGKCDGTPVRVQFNMPIRFTLN